MYKSVPVKNITDEEKQILLDELNQDFHWDFHSPGNTGNLKDGRTVYIRQVGSLLTHRLHYKHGLPEKFPKTLSLLEKWFPNRYFGKVYWHRLLPGDKIEPHDDTPVGYVRVGKLEARYQIYLDIPDGMIIHADNNQLINNGAWNNTLVKFELSLSHAYHNTSDKPVFLFVFDVMKEGVIVHESDRD